MQVFLPPEGLTNLGEASPSQDNVFCAQLQRFQIKNMNERGLHSWHAENCYKKFPFLCKRRACTPRGRPVRSFAPGLGSLIVDRCSFSCSPRRANVRGHQGQRGERGLLLHAEGRRPVSELHVSRRRAGDVRGGAVRAAAGLPALPQGPQGVLQVHLPRPRYPAVGTGSTSRLFAFFLSSFFCLNPSRFPPSPQTVTACLTRWPAGCGSSSAASRPSSSSPCCSSWCTDSGSADASASKL